MAASRKPFDQFGPYILFRKLETDALGELWRAARIDGTTLGPTVALRRLTGGNREAFLQSVERAKIIVPLLSGTSFVKNQSIDVINGTPFVAHEYGGGRSLRHVIDRARGGNGVTPNPIPIDQAIVIAEKVALSLAATSEMKYDGARLTHGALLPQFVWISDDGEIRVAGQQLGKGFAGSLKDPKFAAEFGRYAAPELHTSGEPSKSSEVFALGAILYLVVTGAEPPDATSASAFANTVIAAKTFAGTPIPDDIRSVIAKSLTLDPASRYATVADMKAALSALANGGKYSASTFNLAFYLSNLLKKELEGEAVEREKEAKVNVAAYVDAPAPAPVLPVAAAPAPAPIEPAMFGAHQEEPKSKAPLAIAALVVLAAGGGGIFYALNGNKKAAPAPAATQASTVPVAPAKPKIVSAPIVADAGTGATATTATVDPNAQKKAFEDAVQQKLNEEMMKLQSDYLKKLQQEQSKHAPVAASPAPSTPAPAPAQTAAIAQQPRAEESHPSAAALDAQRRESQPIPQPSAPAPAPQVAQQAPAPAAAPTVHEGDVVEINSLDVAPVVTSPIRVVYPPLAKRERVQASVIVTALISETGEVLDVRVLRGDERFGINDAAIRAMKGARFSSPIKEGKRVKTWYPQTIQFKL